MVRIFVGTCIMSAVLALACAQPAHSQEWKLTDGAARDVGVGADGSVWVIGTNPVAGGYTIWRRVNNAWVNVPGGAERIAVDPQGNAWVVNSTQAIFRFDGSKWLTVNGTARDVGVGANGTVWVIGNNAEAGGYGIYRSTDKGANWTKIPGSAVRVSVDPQGNAWVVNNTNAIFRYDGNNWVQVPGAATDVGVGSDGAVWVIGSGNSIWRWESTKWVQKTGGAAQIAAGPNGLVWVVNQGNQIYNAALPATVVVAQQNLNIPAPSQPVTVPNPVPNITPPSTAPGTPGNPIIISGGPGIAVTPPGTNPQPTQPNLTVGSGTNLGSTYTPGKVGNSQATCGVYGKGLCSPVAAQLVGNADINCPTGSFPDLGRSACFSCPEGFTRSIHPVDNYKACQKPDSSITGGYKKATFRGPLCAAGTFYDPIRGGQCYSCPGGYNRSAAHIEAANACYVPIHENFSSATRVKNTAFAWDCGSGTFWDGYDGGACWSCPDGYRRTAYHINDISGKACAQSVGETWSTATLVKKAECGPGEIQDAFVEGTQNSAFGGGCWTCPTGTDRTVNAIYGNSGCEQAPGIQWAAATRTRGMTCEPDQIFDSINSGEASVASALATRNQRTPTVQSKSSGGTCWTCPAGYKRTTNAVYSGSSCNPPGIAWQSAPYNQPGLFGLQGAEAVALKLVNERTTINTVIQGLVASGNAPANFGQVVWDQIATRPQESAALSLAVFSRVVAAANNPSAATPDERALLEDVINHITKYRVFMAQDALDAYLAWKGGEAFRSSVYRQSQLQVMTNIGEVPPDFDTITAGNIMGSLGAITAANTAIYLTMTTQEVWRALFPFAYRALEKAIVAASAQAGARLGGAVLTTAAEAAAASASIAASAGPQIIVTFGLVILQVAIEQQIAIAEAEPKLRANLTVAQNYRADFPRLMATAEGSTQAQGYWSTLMAGPAQRADGTRPSPIAPQNLSAFSQAALAAKQALVAQR